VKKLTRLRELGRMKSVLAVLRLIVKIRSDLQSDFIPSRNWTTNKRNQIRMLQWILGIRTRYFAESSPLMEKEDAKALKSEQLLRKSLRRKN